MLPSVSITLICAHVQGAGWQGTSGRRAGSAKQKQQVQGTPLQHARVVHGRPVPATLHACPKLASKPRTHTGKPGTQSMPTCSSAATLYCAHYPTLPHPTLPHTSLLPAVNSSDMSRVKSEALSLKKVG